MHSIDRSRRRFLGQTLTALGAAAAAAGATPLAARDLDGAALQARAEAAGRQAQTGRAASAAAAAPPSPVVRVRGRVRAASRGVPRVAMSDGLTVVATDADGRFELIAPRDALIRCSVPGDFEIARDEHDIARLYQPIVANDAGEASLVFDLQARTTPADRHRFYVLADPQTQTAAEMQRFQGETVPDVQALVAAHAGVPSFGVGDGDLMFDDLSLFPEYERAVHAMGLPFVQVKGNHDLDQLGRTSEAASLPFIRRYGPSYYSFNVGAMHYIVLDDVLWHGTGFIGYIDDRQLRWLEADLARIEHGRAVVVFQHIPLLSTQYRRRSERAPSLQSVVTNRMAIYRLLQPYKAHVMSGHTHENENVLEGGVFEHIHGAVCGAWWTGPIGQDGSPNGYGVYEARGEQLTWHYKATGQPSTFQLRVYGPGTGTGGGPGSGPRSGIASGSGSGTDPKQADALIANVWNWDPEWKVTWVEDGQPRGPMTAFTGPDPLAVTLLQGPDLPKGREWIEPAPTSHLFRCTPSVSAREVRVEVVDRFGAPSVETWRRGAASESSANR